MQKNDRTVKVAFAGGGTGGHIYPGLAVADSLRRLCLENGLDLEIHWIGNSSGMDRNIVQKNVDAEGRASADFFYGIPSGKLRRYFSLRNFFDIFKIFAGFVCSFFILARTRPAVLFSKGGFVSVPPCIASRLLRIPVFTHECDFTPGLATRINSRFAKKVLLSYRETGDFLPKKISERALVTGNPVRPVFYSADPARGFEFLKIADLKNTGGKPVLLVLGGSSGARQINDLVEENLAWLCERFIVVHQTGSGVKTSETDFSCSYRPYQFIYSQMPDVVSAADLVLSRSGANSIWECAVLSKPMVLVPLCGSGTRGDQEDNAEFFRKAGAALVLSGEDANSKNLRAALEKMLDADERRKFSLSSAALCTSFRPAEKIAGILYDEMKV